MTSLIKCNRTVATGLMSNEVYNLFLSVESDGTPKAQNTTVRQNSYFFTSNMSDVMTPSKTEAVAMSHTEKSTVSNDDGLPPDVAALLQEFTGPKYDKLMRKMDLHLIPIVSSSSYIYCFLHKPGQC